MDARRWMLLGIVVGAGCVGVTTGPDHDLSESDPGSVGNAVVIHLLAPAPNVVITQNDPSLGCPAHPHRGFGFRINFAWEVSDPDLPIAYNLYVEHEGAEFPARDIRVDSTVIADVNCNSFVIDRNLDNWRWRVRAQMEDGEWSPWSEWGPFRFGPCRLDDGRACSAPPDPPARGRS